MDPRRRRRKAIEGKELEVNHSLTVSSFYFPPPEVPLELAGLVPKDLFDLFDVAIKWGIPTDNGNMLGVTFIDDRGKILVTAHLSQVRSGFNGIFICREHPDKPGRFDVHDGVISLCTHGRVSITWHRRVLLEEARNAVIRHDIRARMEGRVTDTGDRISI